MSYFGIQKWIRLFKIIRQNGGLMKSAYKLWRFDDIKDGCFVGCDANGNKYFQNCNYMIGRSRWVEYNPNVRWDYEGSQITAEWFGWIHYKTDVLPCQDAAKYGLNSSPFAHSWLQPHVENVSGTEEAFYPFSTVNSHIKMWDGFSVNSREKHD